MIKVVKTFLVLAIAATVIFLNSGSEAVPALGSAYTTSSLADTGAENAVTAIYLNYRVYDSIFETLMLLVCVSAVIHFSWRKDHG